MGVCGTVRVLIIDFYDSYTNSILQLLQGTRNSDDGTKHPEWSSAVIRFDQYSWEHFRDNILPDVDAIILSPGPGRPDRVKDFGFASTLIREANIPILGVCLGHQGIGTTFGAKIIHAPHIKHGQSSNIGHIGTGVLKGLPQNFASIRYNSLVLDFDGLSESLEVTAWTYDPEDPETKVLMGLQHKSRPIFGIQWHPESVCSTHGKAILDNFREVTINFWQSSTPWNRWTWRPIGRNASLPPNVLDESAIVPEVLEAVRSYTPSRTLSISPDTERPYYVKSVSLGRRGLSAKDTFDHFIRGSTLDGEAWLDSAKVRDVHSRNSYLAPASFSLSYSTESRTLSFHQKGKKIGEQCLNETYWNWLDRFHKEVIQNNTQALSAQALDQEAEVGQPILQVGLIGYLGYELKREALPGYDYARSDTEADDGNSDTQLLFADTVLWLDNYTREWKAIGLIRRDEDDPIGQAIGASSPVGKTESEFDAFVAQIKEAFARPPSPPRLEPAPLPSFVGLDNEASYKKLVEACRASIKEGEYYEATLTTRFLGQSDADSYSLYLYLRERNPAPYSAYLNFPSHDLQLLSSSPERFISIDRDGVAEMKPIKGTVKRSLDPDQDAQLARTLQNDRKELAENLMIVDLIRADLHNVSPSCSITVPKLLFVESYETVHQLVTTIQSQIAPKVGGVRAIEKCFPPGSMTGAPKLRSVQLLEPIESHRERGPYAGSLGYFCASGTVDQSVIIRTIIKRGTALELGAGGAITWLSDPKSEWEEVLVKANAVAEAKPFGSARLPLSHSKQIHDEAEKRLQFEKEHGGFAAVKLTA